MEVSNGELSAIIKRNSPIPFKISKPYVTVLDNQTSMRVSIWEGERTLAKDNHFLGQLIIKGLPPKPKKEVTVNVQLEIDANGILKVLASEHSTNEEASTTIDTRTLTKQTVDKLIAEAQANCK